MRVLGSIGLFTFVTLILSGCSGHTLQDLADKHINSKESTKKEESVSATKNEALNKVSPINQNRNDGAMQKSLDNWLQTDWTPTVQKDEKIKKVDANESRNFTLQEYVDKAVAYSKNKPASTEPSNVEQMNKMPVIGK
jgi:hypothetical protein